VDLESAVEELYAGSPDDFIEHRKELVVQARAAKDRALVTALGKLRRPTRSAWLVNLYAREAPDELQALLDLGEALQAAQQQLSGPDLRRLSADRGKTLAAATRRAVTLGRDHGYDAPEAARSEVSQTLQAALADPEVASQVRAGRVTQAHTYGGFGFDASTALAPPRDRAPEKEPDGAEPGDETGTADEERAEAEAEERRAEAEREAERAEAELGAAAEAADEATERADQLADRVEELRTELERAEAAEAEARSAARAARRRVPELEDAVRSARKALEAL
jgi:hypothetical protein